MAEQQHSENITNIGVSTKLGEIRNAILLRGNELERRVHPRIGELVNDTLKEIEEHSCRIAFVGQVKAGKSSLINALIQKPGFLPTDVNPSTAVVTKLIFGSRSQAGSSALFHFFTEDEWNEIVSPGAVKRKRSSGFALPSARQKLGELQRRAERRLGADFPGLLGKNQMLSAVTPEAIKKYVSASERFAQEDPVYSDITRMAEIFFDSEPYLYPSVIIDTPGINDLFFVRDEVTYANLADADIYVLLISAQQPLSNSDLALLRLLRGLQKDRIVAVINRIDILENPHDKIASLVEYVRQTLARECPHASISVMPASAHWGNSALKAGLPNSAITLSADVMRYANSLGLVNAPGGKPPDAREVLNLCSGIPRLTQLIGKLMANAITEEQLLPGASTLSAIANNALTSSRFAFKALSFDVLAKDKILSEVELRKRALENLRQIDLLVKNIDSMLAESMISIEKLIASETQSLENFIFRSASAFADEQSQRYFDSRPAAYSELFSRSSLAFRSELAEGFARYYTGGIDAVSEQLRAAEGNMRNMVKSMLPLLDDVVQFGIKPAAKRVSSVVSLAKATPLETAEFWDWFTKSPEQNPENLRRLIVSEFISILNEITETGSSSLRLFASDGLRRLKLLGLGAVLPVAEYIEKLIHFHQEASKTGKGAPDSKEWAVFEKEAQGGIDLYQGLVTEFNDLRKRCFLAPSY